MERERERYHGNVVALNPKEYQRGPWSLGSGSRLHASCGAKVFEDREGEMPRSKLNDENHFSFALYMKFAAFIVVIDYAY